MPRVEDLGFTNVEIAARFSKSFYVHPDKPLQIGAVPPLRKMPVAGRRLAGNFIERQRRQPNLSSRLTLEKLAALTGTIGLTLGAYSAAIATGIIR